MQSFEFVAILLSIVISFALAHLLGGIAHIIANGAKRFSLLLAQWIAWVMLAVTAFVSASPRVQYAVGEDRSCR